MSIAVPGAEGILRQEVLARLEAAGRSGMEEGTLGSQTEGTAEELGQTLRSLEKEGRAVEIDGRWFVPGHSDWAVGVVERLEEGDALIRPNTRPTPRGEPLFFIRKRNLHKALDGDLVVVRKLGKQKPWSDRPAEGMIVKVLGTRLD